MKKLLCYWSRTAVFLIAIIRLRSSVFPDISSFYIPFSITDLTLSFIIPLARLIGSISGLIGLVYDKANGVMVLLISQIICILLSIVIAMTIERKELWGITVFVLSLYIAFDILACPVAYYQYRLMKQKTKQEDRPLIPDEKHVV